MIQAAAVTWLPHHTREAIVAPNKSSGPTPQPPEAFSDIHLRIEIVILRNISLSRRAVKRAWTRCQSLTGKFSFRSLNLYLWEEQTPQKIKLSLSSFFHFLPLHPSQRTFHSWCLTVVIKWLHLNFRDLSNTSPSPQYPPIKNLLENGT